MANQSIPLTASQIEALEALAKKATPRPWPIVRIESDRTSDGVSEPWAPWTGKPRSVLIGRDHAIHADDLALAAALVNAWPALRDLALEALRGRQEGMVLPDSIAEMTHSQTPRMDAAAVRASGLLDEWRRNGGKPEELQVALSGALEVVLREASDLERENARLREEWDAERNVMMNGERMLCRALKPHAEREHSTNPTHDTGELLNLIRHIESVPPNKSAVRWMNEMKERAERAESALAEAKKVLRELVRQDNLMQVEPDDRTLPEALKEQDAAWQAARALVQEGKREHHGD